MDTLALTTFPPRNPAGSMQNTVHALGWASIGLGVLGILAPSALSRNLGVASKEGLLAGFGVRELTAGVGILTATDPRPWIWARVAGDVVDIAALTSGATSGSRRKGSARFALFMVAGITMVDVLCAQWLTSFQARRAQPVPDYSSRSGFPAPAKEMRGKAVAASGSL